MSPRKKMSRRYNSITENNIHYTITSLPKENAPHSHLTGKHYTHHVVSECITFNACAYPKSK